MDKNKRQPTQITLLIRCLVAGYLIYLAHGLISDLGTAKNPRLMAIFAVLFTFAGVLLIAFAVKAFVKKEYKDVRDIDRDEDVPGTDGGADSDRDE